MSLVQPQSRCQVGHSLDTNTISLTAGYLAVWVFPNKPLAQGLDEAGTWADTVIQWRPWTAGLLEVYIRVFGSECSRSCRRFLWRATQQSHKDRESESQREGKELRKQFVKKWNDLNINYATSIIFMKPVLYADWPMQHSCQGQN